MVSEDALEDHGLTEGEWDILLLIKERPGVPIRELAQAAHMKEREFRVPIKALSDLGYVKPGKTFKKESWVCTRKGHAAITTVKSESKVGKPATPLAGDDQSVPGPRRNEGATISTLFIMCSIIGFAKECEGLTMEWLQVLIMLRGRELQTGNDDGLTIPELAAMMGHEYVGSGDLLEDKIAKRLARNRKLAPDERWFEQVEGVDALTITLTSAGRSSLDLIREDLESRMNKKR